MKTPSPILGAQSASDKDAAVKQLLPPASGRVVTTPLSLLPEYMTLHGINLNPYHQQPAPGQGNIFKAFQTTSQEAQQ